MERQAIKKENKKQFKIKNNNSQNSNKNSKHINNLNNNFTLKKDNSNSNDSYAQKIFSYIEKKEKNNNSKKDSRQNGASSFSKNNQSIIAKEELNLQNIEIYGEENYRWFILISYCLCVFGNGMQWVTFSAIATQFGEEYNISSWKVNMFSLIYMIIYPFVTIPQSWLIDNYSFRLGMMIASTCTILGAGLKLFVNHDKSLTCCFIAQFLDGFFQPAMLNSPGKLAADWFNENVRTLICTIGCLADVVGILVGFSWNLAFIHENSRGEKFKKEVFNYFLSEFVLNVVFCLPVFFIKKNCPDIPSSPSQHKDIRIRNTLCTSLKNLFTNKRFIYLLISTFFVVGYYDVMGTVVNSLFLMYGITAKESSTITVISSIIGVLISIIISVLLDKNKKFYIYMIYLCIIGAICQALFTLLLELALHYELNKYFIGLIMYNLVNAIVISFYTIGMNYACEITYPDGESLNGGLMMTMSQISGIGGTFLCDHFINNYKDKRWITNVILLGFFVGACIFVLFFDSKLERNEIDIDGRKLEKEQLKLKNEKINLLNKNKGGNSKEADSSKLQIFQVSQSNQVKVHNVKK